MAYLETQPLGCRIFGLARVSRRLGPLTTMKSALDEQSSELITHNVTTQMAIIGQT